MNMSKNLILASTLSVLVIGGIVASGKYNTLVPLDEKVNSSYAQLQVQLKRQADLIPNLADVVKGYMNSEQKTMIEVAAARAGDAAKMKPSDVANNPELQKKLVEAQANASRAMADVRLVVEKYPELKSNESVKSLMIEVTGTANRIATARARNQQVVTEFNLEVRQFPGNMVAYIVGFPKKPYFEANESEKDAPKLNFSK